jgi:hypothetical protein
LRGAKRRSNPGPKGAYVLWIASHTLAMTILV